MMKNKDYIPYLLLASVAVLIFALSDYIQWFGDSYHYRFDFATGDPIESFWDIFPSQYAHYFLANGRVWAHVLCQGFSALWGQTAFAVCNALVYVVFVLLFVKCVGGDWRNTPTLLSCIIIILLFADTVYNANCQIGYIWTATATLAFLIQYSRAKESKDYRIWELVLIFFLSLLAGNGNDAIAIGVGAALIVDFFMNFKKLTLGQWVMLIGFGIGGLILCLSPGSIHRATSNFVPLIYSLYRIMVNSRALILLLVILCALKLTHSISLRQFARKNIFLLVAGATLLLFNLVIGTATTGRQLFGVELFSAILAARALKNYAFPKWALLVLSILTIFVYALKFEYLRESNEDLRLLRERIESSEDGIVFIDFKKYETWVKPTEVNNKMLPSAYVDCGIIDDMNNRGRYYQILLGVDVTPYPIDYNVYPTALREVLKSDDRNSVTKGVDGKYLIVQDSKNPATFVLHRQINILGLKFPLHPYTIEFNDDNCDNYDGAKIMLEDFEIPLVENGEIEIVRTTP